MRKDEIMNYRDKWNYAEHTHISSSSYFYVTSTTITDANKNEIIYIYNGMNIDITFSPIREFFLEEI